MKIFSKTLINGYNKPNINLYKNITFNIILISFYKNKASQCDLLLFYLSSGDHDFWIGLISNSPLTFTATWYLSSYTISPGNVLV